MSTTTRSQLVLRRRRSQRHGADFVLGGADDVDRRHLLERGDEVLPDDRAVLDDERFQLAHGLARLRRRLGRVGREIAQELGRGDKGRQGRARFGDTGAPSVRQGRHARTDREALFVLVGDFLHSAVVVHRASLAFLARRHASSLPRRRRWSSARSASPSRTCSARSSPRRWSRAGRPASHKPGLGNTGILEQALASGAVDLYPEYTGTIVRELLKREGNPVARRAEPLARAARPEGRGAVRLQQHLCAGDDAARRRERSASRASPTCSSRRAERSQARPVARVPASAPTAGRRLRKAYGAARRRRRSASTTASPTTRVAGGTRRRHRRLLDRRQARPARPARCSRTTAASSRSTTPSS